MNSISIENLKLFNYDFEKHGPVLEKLLTFTNLEKEATFLNRIESAIPEKMSFDLHFDMILEGRVTQYHKALNKGRNLLLESTKIPSELQGSITEAIETLKSYITTALNEAEALQLGAPNMSFNPIAPLTARAGSGTWSVLRGLWDAVTEGGSIIGIIQFIIDIIGLVGDFIFPGVGVVADLINAIIYAIRGQWLLCAISVIAAVVIGAGDALKVFKPVAKTASPIFVKLATKGGAKEAAEALAKTGAKESSSIVKFLRKIASFIGGALGSATSLMGKFFQNIGKVFSYVPGLNLIMTPIFKGLGSVLKSFGDKMSIFSANFKLLEKEAASIAIKDVEKFLATSTEAELTADAKYLKILKDGKPKLIPTKFIDSTQYFTTTYTKDGATILFKDSKSFLAEYAKMNKVMATPTVKEAFAKRFAAYYKGRKKAFKVNAALIIGKAIYHFIYGEEWKPGKRWNKSQIEGFGNGAFNQYIDREIEKKKNKTGAAYVPSVVLNSTEKEVYDRVNKYNDHLSKLTGNPTIIDAMGDKFRNDKTMDAFNSFFNDISSGKIKNGGVGDKSSDLNSEDDYENVIKVNDQDTVPMGESLIRTVLNFSDFKKS